MALQGEGDSDDFVAIDPGEATERGRARARPGDRPGQSGRVALKDRTAQQGIKCMQCMGTDGPSAQTFSESDDVDLLAATVTPGDPGRFSS